MAKHAIFMLLAFFFFLHKVLKCNNKYFVVNTCREDLKLTHVVQLAVRVTDLAREGM